MPKGHTLVMLSLSLVATCEDMTRSVMTLRQNRDTSLTAQRRSHLRERNLHYLEGHGRVPASDVVCGGKEGEDADQQVLRQVLDGLGEWTHIYAIHFGP